MTHVRLPRPVPFRFLAALSLATAPLVAPASASDWPRFRGPDGAGVSPDGGLPSALDPETTGLWSVAFPRGNSSPIVVGGRLFLTGHEGDQQRLTLCLDAATGREIWRRAVERTREETFNRLNGPTTPSPATDGENVYVFFPEVGLVSYDREGGERWRTPLGPFTSIQGLATSPVHVDGRIVLLVDTPEEAYLSAFDAQTGRPLWRVERPMGMLGSYATPVVWAPEGKGSQIVVAGAVELTGYDAETGRRLWWVNGLTYFPTSSPFLAGDALYTLEPAEGGWPPFDGLLSDFDPDKDGRVSIADASDDTIWARSLIGMDRHVGNGDGIVTREEYALASNSVVGGGLTRVRLGGEGDLSSSAVVWRHTKGMPSLSGALLYRGVLYVIRNAIVSTFDPETGELLRRERVRRAVGDYYASPVAGDGKIYLASLDGKVSVLRAGRDWEVLSVHDLGEQIIATPALADGRVYVRTKSTLHCFGGGSPEGPPQPATTP
jgi:outer membrane protein assembly factor BamB